MHVAVQFSQNQLVKRPFPKSFPHSLCYCCQHHCCSVWGLHAGPWCTGDYTVVVAPGATKAMLAPFCGGQTCSITLARQASCHQITFLALRHPSFLLFMGLTLVSEVRCPSLYLGIFLGSLFSSFHLSAVYFYK